ncbi:hypothetical protein GCM10009839_79410 [Catenulispora yoronensis]|uniref:Uncharacterized protein n=1 Tax=Catenulispora yoronensis TaxID=450799 RepID=A0ABP5GUW6_9ACTN
MGTSPVLPAHSRLSSVECAGTIPWSRRQEASVVVVIVVLAAVCTMVVNGYGPSAVGTTLAAVGALLTQVLRRTAAVGQSELDELSAE